MAELRVFTFAGDWGLPTTGPFALKLLGWMGLNGIAYEQVIENNPAKGPLGKSPWIEVDGKRIGDSDVVIRFLAERHRIPVEPEIDAPSRAIAHAWRMTFEEHFHQVLEWELFVNDAGFAYIDKMTRDELPPVMSVAVSHMMRRHFRRQLAARGIGRHSAETVADMGRRDVDSLADYLAGRLFIGGDNPSLADLSVFGQVAPPMHWHMDTPVANHIKTLTPLRGWCDRVAERCFPETGNARRSAA